MFVITFQNSTIVIILIENSFFNHLFLTTINFKID